MFHRREEMGDRTSCLPLVGMFDISSLTDILNLLIISVAEARSGNTAKDPTVTESDMIITANCFSNFAEVITEVHREA